MFDEWENDGANVGVNDGANVGDRNIEVSKNQKTKVSMLGELTLVK